MPLAILLHIVFGIIAFAGSLSLGASFGTEFKSLKISQKTAIILSYVGGVASSMLGIIGMTTPVVAIILSLALVVFTAFVFKSVFIKKTATVKSN